MWTLLTATRAQEYEKTFCQFPNEAKLGKTSVPIFSLNMD